jgi:hypothetical protein
MVMEGDPLMLIEGMTIVHSVVFSGAGLPGLHMKTPMQA